MIGPLSLAVYRGWARLRARLFISLARGAFHGVGSGSVIDLPVRLSGEQRIRLGRQVYIGAGSWLQVLKEAVPGPDPVISIGDGVSMSGFCTVSAACGIVIEERALIARYVYLADHSHAIAAPDRAIKDQGITQLAPVRIGAGAWLGQNVVVCPGVTIGRNAVVGANSVVRQDVPDYCVAAGVPARVIRRIDQPRPS